ncbi:MAG UNVERIFIED_CONTAM: acetamidase/formamidase family protein [Planctomycetaceae bacterium]
MKTRSSGQIRQPGDRRDKSTVPWSNPVAGPILVEDAQPGDELAVTILDIQPRDGQCATWTGHQARSQNGLALTYPTEHTSARSGMA